MKWTLIQNESTGDAKIALNWTLSGRRVKRTDNNCAIKNIGVEREMTTKTGREGERTKLAWSRDSWRSVAYIVVLYLAFSLTLT